GMSARVVFAQSQDHSIGATIGYRIAIPDARSIGLASTWKNKLSLKPGFPQTAPMALILPTISSGNCILSPRVRMRQKEVYLVTLDSIIANLKFGDFYGQILP
ncbi:hypothetical protein IAQ61_008932, partial [Plenodomus lingam]